MNIQRYEYTYFFKWNEKKVEIVEFEDGECVYDFRKSENGKWVRYEDIKHLLDTHEENRKLRILCKKYLAWHGVTKDLDVALEEDLQNPEM